MCAHRWPRAWARFFASGRDRSLCIDLGLSRKNEEESEDGKIVALEVVVVEESIYITGLSELLMGCKYAGNGSRELLLHVSVLI